MKEVLLLLPTQLFESHKSHKNINNVKDIYLLQHPKFFTYHKFHKNKLHFHYATMYAYENKMKKKYNFSMIDKINEINKHTKVTKLYIYDPVDFEIEKEIIGFCKKKKIELEIIPTPLFLLTKDDLEEYKKSTKKPYFNHTFYVWIRNKTGILMDKNNKPIGGSYSYDTKNRLKFENNYKEQKLKLYSNQFIKKAENTVKINFKNNPGEITPFVPVTHKEAYIYFNNFLKHKFNNFGPYEDAFRSDVLIGYHSCISALLNVGLLDVKKVIELTLDYYKVHKVKLESVEGFLRQILSWREYSRMLYIYEHKKFIKENFFKHQRKINKNWFEGSTGMPPVDNVIKKINVLSYAHHIERLMILANFALLSKIKPKEIYNWFISFVSIDAYEWVMEPNVYGMGVHSVGTLMMNRPYFSSSNYLYKMGQNKVKSKIKLGTEEYDWDEVWDALYYNFINSNKLYLKKIYSTAASVANLNKKSSEEIRKLTLISNLYLKKY